MNAYAYDFEEYLDDMLLQDCDKACEIRLYGNLATWRTRECEDIMVKDMSDSHLMNTIRFLKKVMDCESQKAWIEVMTDELERRK